MNDQERKAMEMALEALEWHEEQDEEIRYDECPSRSAMDDLRIALAQPEPEVSYTDIQMAELIMSDCGHSSDYTPLLNRIAGRLATYRQALAKPDEIQAAVLEEREACAKLCEKAAYWDGNSCAEDIRARGDKHD